MSNITAGFFVDAYGQPSIRAGLTLDAATGAPSLFTAKSDGSLVLTPLTGLAGTTYAGLTDAGTVNLPTINGPLNTALGILATAAAAASAAAAAAAATANAAAVKAQAFAFGSFIATVSDGDIVLLRIPFAMTIVGLKGKCTGTTTLTAKKNGTPFGSGVAFSSTDNSGTLNQTFAAGDYIALTASSSSSCTNLAWEFDYTRSLA